MTNTPSSPTQEEREITDCGDEGCAECDVCRYLDFLEWAGSVGKPDGSVIQRDEVIEAHLRRTQHIGGENG